MDEETDRRQGVLVCARCEWLAPIALNVAAGNVSFIGIPHSKHQEPSDKMGLLQIACVVAFVRLTSPIGGNSRARDQTGNAVYASNLAVDVVDSINNGMNSSCIGNMTE